MATAEQWIEHQREEIANTIDMALEWIEKNCTEDDLYNKYEHEDWKWGFLMDLKDDLKERIKEHDKARRASLPKAERKKCKERERELRKLHAISTLERIAIEWADRVERANERLARNYTEQELEALIGVRWRECIWERMGASVTEMADFYRQDERDHEERFSHTEPRIRRQIFEQERNNLRVILELAATPDKGLEFEFGADWEKEMGNWTTARAELLRRRDENGGRKLPLEQEREIIFEALYGEMTRRINARVEERRNARLEEPEADQIN